MFTVGTSVIFVMWPSYLHRLVSEYDEDLADKAHLFADPFTRPVSFANGAYKVFDPSFDNRPTSELLKEFGWMRERVLQIRRALLRDGRELVPLSESISSSVRPSIAEVIEPSGCAGEAGARPHSVAC
jgi:hypothetical protein